MDYFHLALACLLFASTAAEVDHDYVSNAGTEFYLMFMPNLIEKDLAQDEQMAFIVSNPDFSTHANITITMPNMNSSFEMHDYIAPKDSHEIMLPKEAMHFDAGKGDFGIYITSDHPVTVVGVNRQRYSVDSFLALPRHSLGIGYIGASFTANIRSQLGIVATLDDTKIHVKLPSRNREVDVAVTVEHNGIYYSNAAGAQSEFDIVLNKHDSYLLTSKGDLTGTQIRAGKRISVFGGNVRAKIDGNSRDHLVEQLLPVYSWQQSWYTVPTPHRVAGDHYRILTNTPGNLVDVYLADGTHLPQVQVPTPADFAEIEIPSRQPARFTCSQKCLVYQVSSSVRRRGSLGDPSMFLASNPELFGSHKYILRAPVTSQGTEFANNTVVIMAKHQVQPRFYYTDGTNYPSNIQWTYIADWGIYYAYLQLPFTQQSSGVQSSLEPVVIRTNLGDHPFVLWLHGMSDRESYAHPLGFHIESPECLQTNRAVVVPGDGIDNDCDDLIDEEAYDGIDNDGDGLIDEDIGSAYTKLSSGQEFLVMFMENRVDFPLNPPMELYVAAYDTVHNMTTNITVSYFTSNGTHEELHEHVFAGEVHKIEFNHTIMQEGTTLAHDKAIHIEANHDIVVYGINKEKYSADGFLALPVSTFGADYFTVNYHPATTAAEFAVVAAHNDTYVTITFPALTNAGEEIAVVYNGTTYSNGDHLEVHMEALDTLQIQDESGDLSGTRIHANHPVGVFSGNIRTHVTYNGVTTSGSRDHLVEQIPPISSYGHKFAMMTTPDRSVGDYYKFVSSEEDTHLRVCKMYHDNPTVTCNTMNITCAGCHQDLSVFESDQTFYVESDKPIMVVQVARSQESREELADPVLMVIPPLEQYHKDYTFLTPSISDSENQQDYLFHSLMVIVNGEHTEGLEVDHNATSLSGVEWHPIPDPNNTHHLVAGSIRLPSALHTLSHTDPSVVYTGFLYGVADRESYGFPIGLRLHDQRFCVPTPNVVGDHKDNDCDGVIDEEICGNALDDDLDGKLDEDCQYLPTNHTYLAVFMENTVEEPAANFPLRIYGASYHNQVLRVSTPQYYYDGDNTYDNTMRIDSDHIMNFGLRPQIKHVGTGISKQGVIIKSEHLMDIFGSNEEKFSHDCFLVLPSELLGTEYYTVHYSPSYLQQQFAITPLENNTHVFVHLDEDLPNKITFEDVNHSANETFDFFLNIGESAQIQTENLSPHTGLTGSRVTSDKPIAVFSGNVRTMVDSVNQPLRSRDHLAEQLLPYNHWGTVYYAPTTPLREGDIRDVFLFVSKFNTTLTIQDETGFTRQESLFGQHHNAVSLPSGEDHHYRFSAPLPFQVVRVTWSWRKGVDAIRQGDPAMLLLVPEDLRKNRYSFALPVYTGGDHGGDYTNVIQLIVPRTKTNGVRIDGKDVVGTWHRIGNSDHSVMNVELSHHDHIAVSHAENVPFSCYLYGAADRESYSMPCGIHT